MGADLDQWYTIGGANGGKPVKLANIIILVGDCCSVTFYVKDDDAPEGFIEEVVKKNLKKFEGIIHTDFERINQSHIVNINFVDRIQNNIIVLKKPLEWERNVTEGYRDSFKKRLGLKK